METTINGWLTAALSFLAAGGGGGLVYLLKTPGEMKKTDAETGLTNTQAATQLSESWAKLVSALEGQVSSAVARASAAETRAGDAEGRLTRAQDAMGEMEARMTRMQSQIVVMENELAACRESHGPPAE